MVPPSLSRSLLFGRVSKPSVGRPVKSKPAPAISSPSPEPGPAPATSHLSPTTQASRPAIGQKRKRDGDPVSNTDDLSCYTDKKTKLSIHGIGRPTSPVKTNSISHSFSKSPRPQKSKSYLRKQPLAHTGTSAVLSEPILSLFAIYSHFLKALSIHYAHSGPTAPAELGRLLDSTTKLWKERSVTRKDVQTMLALHEITTQGCFDRWVDRDIHHSTGPFKLVKTGPFVTVEYSGERKHLDSPMSTLFDGKDLEEAYRSHICTLNSIWTKERRADLAFFADTSLDNFPSLVIETGSQTAACNSRSSQRRVEIMKLSNEAQLRNHKYLITTGSKDEGEFGGKVTVVGGRKQNLMNRIKAKQLVSRSEHKPTAQEILQKHALGRVGEIADILRMMQREQQSKAESRAITSKFATGSRSRKVSFNMTQIRTAIQSSANIPVADDEVLMCLRTMADRLKGNWIKMVEVAGSSSARFVILEGQGMTGAELEKRLTAEQDCDVHDG